MRRFFRIEFAGEQSASPAKLRSKLARSNIKDCFGCFSPEPLFGVQATFPIPGVRATEAAAQEIEASHSLLLVTRRELLEDSAIPPGIPLGRLYCALGAGNARAETPATTGHA